MKTLVLNGSPRVNGDTAALIGALLEPLEGDKRVISPQDNISPCIDCRRCRHTPGCSIDDGMRTAYDYLADCDNIVLASPVWFSSLSGPLLNIASRIQTIFAGSYFRKEQQALRRKRGVILLVGAEPGTEEIPARNALTIMKYMNVDRESVIRVSSMRTNEVPARMDEAALRGAREAAESLNQACRAQTLSRSLG